jgi:hypothetical protein
MQLLKLQSFKINNTLKTMIDGDRGFKFCPVNLVLKFVLFIVIIISI